MSDAFARKLEWLRPLSIGERREVENLTANLVAVEARENLVTKGDRLRSVNVVMSGWACSYEVLRDGRRQILSLFLPGDMCNPCASLLGAVARTVGTLTPCTIAEVPTRATPEWMTGRSDFAERLLWQIMAASEAQRERMVCLGRRLASDCIAHLFCEVLARLEAVGQSNGTDCEWPLTQADLADATGMSAVHVNRSLQELRTSGLIELRNKHLTVLDLGKLTDLAMFDPTYLHLRTE